MKLKETIEKDLKQAMLDKNESKKSVLRVLKGEIERNEQSSKGKIELSDSDIVSIAKKMLEGIIETGGSEDEAKAIEAYVPSQLSDQEIKNIVDAEILTNGYSSMRDIGNLMNFFKENHSGQYDGKIVANTFKESIG